MFVWGCHRVQYWIDEFGLVPDRQSRGKGSAFLRAIEARVADSGMVAVVLLTERTAPAYRFYRKNGFIEQEDNVFFSKAVRPKQLT